MQLSPSKLNVLNQCSRCFWLAEKESIKRPRGIVAGIMGGIDRNLKKYYDASRPNLPDEISYLTEEKLFPDIEKLKKWRHWKSGLTCEVFGVKIIGALDDSLINKIEELSPFDYKSKGSEPKDDGSQYYQTQLDCYDLLLRKNGYKTTGYGYLAYYWPVFVPKSKVFIFNSKVFKVKCSSSAALETIERAKKILESPMPDASGDCEYCEYERQKREYLSVGQNKTN